MTVRLAGNVPTIVLSRTRALHGETPESRLQAVHLQDDIAAFSRQHDM